MADLHAREVAPARGPGADVASGGRQGPSRERVRRMYTLLAWLKAKAAAGEECPTNGDIGEYLNLSSTSSASDLVALAERRGHIVVIRRREAREIVAADGSWKLTSAYWARSVEQESPVIPIKPVAPAPLAAPVEAAPERGLRFYAWLDTAQAGDRLEYARGALAQLRNAKRRTPEQQAMVEDAEAAWATAQTGQVRLIQQRVGDPEDGIHAYVAIRRAATPRGKA